MNSSDEVAYLHLALQQARQLLTSVRADGGFYALRGDTQLNVNEFLNGPLQDSVKDAWLFRYPIEASSQCRIVFSRSIAQDLINQREHKHTRVKVVGPTPPFYSREAPTLTFREDSDINARIVKLFPPQVVKRLERLRQSKEGWDGQDALPLSPASLELMVSLFELYRELPKDLGVFLNHQGELVVNWKQTDGSTIDLVFSGDEIEVATDQHHFFATLNDPQLITTLFGARDEHSENSL